MELKINGKVVPLRSQKSTLKDIKSLVNSYITLFGYDKKTVQITLPSGKIVSYREMDSIKDFAKVLSAGTFLARNVDDGAKADWDKTVKIVQEMYAQPLDLNNVGTKDSATFAQLAADTKQRLVLEEKFEETEMQNLLTNG